MHFCLLRREEFYILKFWLAKVWQFILGGRISNQLIPLVPLQTPLAVQTVERVLERETPLLPVPRLNFRAKVELVMFFIRRGKAHFDFSRCWTTKSIWGRWWWIRFFGEKSFCRLASPVTCECLKSSFNITYLHDIHCPDVILDHDSWVSHSVWFTH